MKNKLVGILMEPIKLNKAITELQAAEYVADKILSECFLTKEQAAKMLPSDEIIDALKQAIENGHNDVLPLTSTIEKWEAALSSRVGGVESKAQLKCVDCGKSDDTVKDRGAFNGVQCYDCKKNQDIEDEECL